jgi:hypothetical protein
MDESVDAGWDAQLSMPGRMSPPSVSPRAPCSASRVPSRASSEAGSAASFQQGCSDSARHSERERPRCPAGDARSRHEAVTVAALGGQRRAPLARALHGASPAPRPTRARARAAPRAAANEGVTRTRVGFSRCCGTPNVRASCTGASATGARAPRRSPRSTSAARPSSVSRPRAQARAARRSSAFSSASSLPRARSSWRSQPPPLSY